MPFQPLDLVADVPAEVHVIGDRPDERIVQAYECRASFALRVVDDLPIESRHGEDLLLGLQPYGPLLAVDVLHRHVTVHPCVNVQVQLTSDGELPDVHFQRVPVSAVERLPLGRSVQVPEGRTLLATVDEVRLGHHVTAR